MNNALTDLLAMLLAFFLAAGTAYGVVQSQQNAGEKVSTTQVSYGK